MNILILTQYYPPEFGGSALTTSQIAHTLVADGHHVTVLTGMPNYPTGIIPPQYRGRVFYKEMLDGVEVRRVWVFASPSKRARSRLLNQISFMLMSALRGTFLSRPDVILVESHPLFVCLSGGWLRRVKRAPLVLNVSDLWPDSAVAIGALKETSLLVRVAKPIERWAYRDATYLVGMTEGVKEGILKICPEPDRVALIRFPVDLTRFAPHQEAQRAEFRARYGLKPEEFVVAFPGNMSLAYDFEVMLDVAEALPEIRFLLAGSGSQAEYVEQQMKTRPLSHMLNIGILPHDQMPALWSAVDVCFFALKEHPLFQGTFPAKMAEAMGAGVPIAASAQGEAKTVLDQSGAGFAVPIGDREGFVSALRQLHTAPELRQQMSRAGRTYAEANLSLENVRKSFLSIFKNVIAARAKPSRQ